MNQIAQPNDDQSCPQDDWKTRREHLWDLENQEIPPEHLTSDQIEAEIFRLFQKLEDHRQRDLIERLYQLLVEEEAFMFQPLTEL